MKERLLTKTLFVRALTCPRKLYYVNKPQYADNSVDDEFLESLAEGGIQVGALARCYFPDGILVAESDRKAALAQTAELLKRDHVTLFEAAIQHGSCFFRADILVKDGSRFDLIEVKAKSYDQDTAEGFLKSRDKAPSSEWKPYLYDVAFQRHILQLAHPSASIRAHLMLADTRAAASVDGLNQRFVIREQKGRSVVIQRGDCSIAGLGDKLLVQVPVNDTLDMVCGLRTEDMGNRPLAEFAGWVAENYANDRKIEWPVGVHCQDCEFRASPEQRQAGQKSGFCECWKEQWGLTEADLDQPNVFDIWNFRGKADLLADRRFFLRDVSEHDITGGKKSKPRKADGLSSVERQWLQVLKAQKGDRDAYFDKAGFAAEARQWRYPLHFIDFETSAVAIPFTRGRHPYEGIAFQFSHHKVSADGRIEHAGQYLNANPGVYPGFDFLRALKKELEGDDGTIFRYAAHENTHLNLIYRLLQEPAAADEPGRDELSRWIKTVTKSTHDCTEEWEGSRNMVDMKELVVRYYYDPYTRGSNSIKKVLPAVLNGSPFLQKKYSRPIYGACGGIPSLNYRDWVWIRKKDNGEVQDPYKLLPSICRNVTDEQLNQIGQEQVHLAEGGASMMAYARLQFEELAESERRDLEAALLRYCELDTMAMVFIWEHWANLLGRG